MPSNYLNDTTEERGVTTTKLTPVLAEGSIVEVLVGRNWKKAILEKPHKDKKRWCAQVCHQCVKLIEY